ncbi:hypothetical protein V496_02142 [Pseudogymnoascus sp. VKM F-4515 (FW-2607)]|nr:hypothetical protein V496_02142 [Pseudogymnoascus sp. VKM F-4515 (FW-2607)]
MRGSHFVGGPRKDPRFLPVALATRMLWFLRRQDFPWYVDDDAALGVPEMTKKMEHKGINNRILKKLGGAFSISDRITVADG